MQYAHHHSPLPDPYAGIVLYLDVSQATILACKNLNSITKVLRNHKILYRWEFPTKLLIKRAIHNMEEGLKTLQQWGLLPHGEDNLSKNSLPGKLPQQWQTKHHPPSPRIPLND